MEQTALLVQTLTETQRWLNISYVHRQMSVCTVTNSLPILLYCTHTHLCEPRWCQAAFPVTSQLLKCLPNKQMPVYRHHPPLQLILLQDKHTQLTSL